MSGAKCSGRELSLLARTISKFLRGCQTVLIVHMKFAMTSKRNIDLEDFDPVDRDKLIARFETFQNGVFDLRKAAVGEEPLFSLEDEP